MISIREQVPGQLSASLQRLRERIKVEAVIAIQRKAGAMAKALKEDAISTRAAASVKADNLPDGARVEVGGPAARPHAAGYRVPGGRSTIRRASGIFAHSKLRPKRER